MRTERCNRWGLAALVVTGVAGQHQATAGCLADEIDPVLTITSPVTVRTHEVVYLPVTAEPILALGGEVDDETISEISWVGPDSSGTATATTDWDGTWRWSIPSIDLVEGEENIITITARDAAGNESTAEIRQVFEMPPPPPPPPAGGGDIVDHKIKITGYSYRANDRYSIVADMVVPSGAFSLPCDRDVTISASILDPDTQQELLLFTDTLPANSAGACSSKYRAVTQAPDLREVRIQQRSDTRVYVYVYAEKGNYLPGWRAAKTDEEFLDDFARIEKTKLTVDFGDGRSWSGWSDAAGSSAEWEKQSACNLLDETHALKKVELRCNR